MPPIHEDELRQAFIGHVDGKAFRGNRKLDSETFAAIYDDLRGDATHQVIADRHGVSRSRVSALAREIRAWDEIEALLKPLTELLAAEVRAARMSASHAQELIDKARFGFRVQAARKHRGLVPPPLSNSGL